MLAPEPGNFDPASFTQGIVDRLRNDSVRYIIVDTRQLLESQVDELRVLLADLPDALFNRVIRSFAFRQK